MDSQDEKFFESLVGGNAEGGIPAPHAPHAHASAPEAELAKADASAVARASHASAPRIKTERDWENEPEGQLTVDVFQTPAEIVVESAIAGVRPDDIDINVTADSISIRGSRHREDRAEDKDYLYQECYWGRFARTVILPQEIDPENATVTFRNGILRVTLPKLAKRKSRKLQVQLD